MELRGLGKDCTVERSRLVGALMESECEDGLNWLDPNRFFREAFVIRHCSCTCT